MRLGNTATTTRQPSLGRQVLRIAGGLLTGLLSVILVSVAFATFIFHLGVQPVLSGSMRPTFGVGSVIITRRIPTGSLRSGEIAVFTPPGLHVQYAHRVVTVSGPADDRVITTKGDANHAVDPWHAHLLGSTVPVVMFSVPTVGHLFRYVHGLGLRLTLLILAGLLLCLIGTKAILGPPPKRSQDVTPTTITTT